MSRLTSYPRLGLVFSLFSPLLEDTPVLLHLTCLLAPLIPFLIFSKFWNTTPSPFTLNCRRNPDPFFFKRRFDQTHQRLISGGFDRFLFGLGFLLLFLLTKSLDSTSFPFSKKNLVFASILSWVRATHTYIHTHTQTRPLPCQSAALAFGCLRYLRQCLRPYLQFHLTYQPEIARDSL